MEGIAYAAAMAALRDADLANLLPTISVPAAVIAGSRDAAVPRDHSERMAVSMPGSRLLVLEGGHLTAVESPNAFVQALVSTIR